VRSQSVEVRVVEDAQEVAFTAASSLVAKVAELLSQQPAVHLVVTGGTVGILTLKKLRDLHAPFSWNQVHIWWGDERFVPSESPDRNAVQAREAWLSESGVPIENIHEFPSSDNELSIDEAARLFDAELALYSQDGLSHPRFDILLLGMGPDGHVASLFPGKSEPALGQVTFAELDSPKPPPLRLTLSYEVLRSAREVWFTIAGQDKAWAVTEAFTNLECTLPVARVNGIAKTVWFLDQAAAVGFRA